MVFNLGVVVNMFIILKEEDIYIKMVSILEIKVFVVIDCFYLVIGVEVLY